MLRKLWERGKGDDDLNGLFELSSSGAVGWCYQLNARRSSSSSGLQAIQGYFAGQLGSVEAEKQRKYEAAQAEKDRQNRLQLGKMGGGSNADPFAIMAAEYGYKRDLLYDANALNSGQPSGGGIGNSIAAGIGTGIGAGIIGAVS